MNIPVKIRGDLDVKKTYDNVPISDDMAKFAGMNATITGIGRLCYKLDIDNGEFFWTSEMLKRLDGDKLKLPTCSEIERGKNP